MNLVKCLILLGAVAIGSFTLKAQQLALGVNNQNIAYIGNANKMKVVVKGVPCSELSVVAESGKIQGGGCNYTWYPAQPGANSIDVYRRTGQSQKKVSSFNVRVRQLPEPRLRFSGYDTGYISRLDLVASSKPIACPYNFDFDMRWVIIQCSVLMQSEGGDTLFARTYKNESGVEFDADALSMFSLLRHNDKVTFSNMSSRRSDGMLVAIRDALFTVSH